MSKEKLTREKISGAAAIAAYVLAGLALIIWPALMTDLARWALVVLLLGFAGIKTCRYAKLPPKEGFKDFSLAEALMAFFIALVLVIDQNVFAQLLPRIWGLLLLVASFTKIQLSMDFLRLKSDKWWWILIGACISLVLGMLCVTSPDFIKGVLSQFIGASLIAEGAIDCAVLFFLRKFKKHDQAPAAPKAEQ